MSCGQDLGSAQETEAGAPRFLSLVLPPPMALVLKDVRVESAWDLVILRGVSAGPSPQKGANRGTQALLPSNLSQSF